MFEESFNNQVLFQSETHFKYAIVSLYVCVADGVHGPHFTFAFKCSYHKLVHRFMLKIAICTSEYPSSYLYLSWTPIKKFVF